MSGHAIISHGLQSGPDATKATALARRAESLGWSFEILDYRDLDAVSQLGDVLGRILRLREAALAAGPRLVLAGSSMGAFISARVSLETPVAGLFLMAPPVRLQGFDIVLEAARVPTRIVHGWHDELIPATEVVRWAATRSDQLVLVDDSHRLAAHIEFCADRFGDFLQELA